MLWWFKGFLVYVVVHDSLYTAFGFESICVRVDDVCDDCVQFFNGEMHKDIETAVGITRVLDPSERKIILFFIVQ